MANRGQWHRPSPTRQQAVNGQSPGLDNPAAVHSRVEMSDYLLLLEVALRPRLHYCV